MAKQTTKQQNPATTTPPPQEGKGNGATGGKPEANQKQPAGQVEVLTVRTKRGVPTFRRSGFRFSREPIGIEVAALEEHQVKALTNEPNLVVEEGSIDASEVAG